MKGMNKFMDRETAMAINDLSKKINEVSQKLDQYFNSQHEDNKANIDYIAMMTDVELPDTSELNNNDQEDTIPASNDEEVDSNA